MIIIRPTKMVPIRGAEAVIATQDGLCTSPVFIAAVSGADQSFVVAYEPQSGELVTVETLPGFIQINIPEGVHHGD